MTTGARTAEILEKVDRAGTVLFDMDGVIIDSESVKFTAYREVFRNAFGVELDHRDIAWRGKPEPEVMGYWLNKHNLQHHDIPALVQKKRDTYRALIASGKIALIPGVREFLQTLRSRGKRMGVATASTRIDQSAIFTLFDLGPFFDAVVTLDDIHVSKPAPDIYLKTAQQLSARAEDCLVFEDSPPGVQAALSANMEVVVVLSSFQRTDFSDSLCTISSFRDLL